MSILRNNHVALSILGVKGHSLKAQPHAAMLHTCDGTFQNSCDGLRCIFQHVGNFAPDFGISQLFSVRFPNDFQQNDGNVINFHVK